MNTSHEHHSEHYIPMDYALITTALQIDYGRTREGETTADAIARRIQADITSTPAGTAHTGNLRIWSSPTAQVTGEPEQQLARGIIRKLGHHDNPPAFHGTIAITMQPSSNGATPPLSDQVRYTLDQYR